MTGLVIGIIVLVLVVGVSYCYFADLNDKLPKMARKGPMYPKVVMRKNAVFLSPEEARETQRCPICRKFFGPQLVSFSDSRLICPDCEKNVDHETVPSFFDGDVGLFKCLMRGEGSVLIPTLESDIRHGDITVDTARKVIKEFADKLYTVNFKRKQPLPNRGDSLDSISRCAICQKPQNHCVCDLGYHRDIESGTFPKRIVPYLAKLRELDPCFKQNLSSYYDLLDWQNVRLISEYVKRGVLPAQYAEKQIDAYACTMIPDLEAQIAYYEALRRGEKPRDLNPPQETIRVSDRDTAQDVADLQRRVMGNIG